MTGKPSQKTILAFVALVVLSTLGIVFFSVYQVQKIIRETEGASPSFVDKKESAASAPLQRVVPMRPQDCGIIVTTEANKPKTQEEWDKFLAPSFNEIRSEIPPEDLSKIMEKVKQDPQKTREKIKQVDLDIQKCADALRSNPKDQKARDKMERLMILRSIAKDFFLGE